ncbi:histone PARylation factor 1 [Ostrinia nubilalis]|uniref:histone PARylation factor 1 n=1 Tax=Ostrinia nubilalis TaxID=29057 RepID=UPI0030824FB6
MPNDEWETFVKDPRTKCKYGENCYQKNPEHHKTYKHPPKTQKAAKNTREKNRFSPFTRKPKAAETKNDQTSEHDQLETDKKGEEKSEVMQDNKQVPSSSVVLNNPPDVEDLPVKLPDSIKFYDTNADPKLFKDLFLVDMPQDFLKFFECLNKDNSIEKMLASVGLQLIGPFDLLLGKLPMVDDNNLYLVHWRFFFDPPEFQAILKRKGASQFHIGYYRDSPEEKPVFLASNDSEKDCRILPVAENIFGAVYLYLQNEKKKSPFTAMACQKLIDLMKKTADEEKFSLEAYTMKKRQGKLIARTLHGAGIIVPYNKKTQLGYRNLAETDENLKKIFTSIKEATSHDEKQKALSDLQPVITYADIAVDECDFGTGLEAGIDLFCSGLKELQSRALSSLTSVYNLLNREAFSKIIQAHLKYRRKGSNLSILDFK